MSSPEASGPDPTSLGWEGSLDVLAQAAFLLDAEGGLLDANWACLEIYGLSWQEFLVGGPVWAQGNLVHEDGSLWSQEDFPGTMALRTGHRVTGQVAGVWNPRTLQRVWLEVNAVPEFQAGETRPHRALVTLQHLTAQRQTAALLRHSEEQFRRLLEGMAEGFAHCRMIYERNRPVDWVYVVVNPAFEVITGLQDVVGRRVTEVIPGIQDSFPDLFEKCDRVARSGEPAQFEIHVEALGTWFSMKVFSPGPDEFVATFENITERRRAAQVLALSESHLRALPDHAPDHILHLDTLGRIQYINHVLPGYRIEDGLDARVLPGTGQGRLRAGAPDPEAD